MALGALGQRLRRPGVWPVAAFLVLVLLALDLMSDAVQKSDALSRAFVPLLVTVLLGLLALGVLLVINLVKLVTRYRRQVAGSRLTGRMVGMFALIALVPVSIVYYYSINLLVRGIDSWFDLRVDQAIEDALDLSKAALGLNQRVLRRYTMQHMSALEDFSPDGLAVALEEMRDESGALELTLVRENGQLVASSIEDAAKLVPDLPGSDALQQLRDSQIYVGLYSRGGDELLVRVLMRLAEPLEQGRPLILQALYPTSAHLNRLSNRLEDAYNHYREMAYLRQSLKFSFSLTLSLVVVFSLMAALLAAFHSARRLVAPVSDIAEGTRAVALGDYEKQLPVPEQDDELSVLVASFNAMTRRLGRARDEAANSRQEVERQRAYLQTVLGRLSSGVVAFDADLNLRTANPAVQQILGLDLEHHLSQPLAGLALAHPRLAPLVEVLDGPLRADQEWRQEVTLFSQDGRQVLLCRVSPFAEPDGQRGHVLVFDDITTLIKAQRDAAWGEVARRLAHEIKNPLTPIQLSAERLRHKFLGRLAEADERILERSTQTIVQQVEAMKTMVNAFSDYARPPKLHPEALVLDALVADVLDLYHGSAGSSRLEVVLGSGGGVINGDALRLRQVIHNLVKNAQEALEGREGGVVRVDTSLHRADDSSYVELKVRDNGPGFDPDLAGRLFDPYVTTKVKGTGLGLAIVKQIVEEHGGIIWAENCSGGACLILRMPVLRRSLPDQAAAAQPTEVTPTQSNHNSKSED